MPHNSYPHGYDPRYIHLPTENYRDTDGGWAIDVRSFPPPLNARGDKLYSAKMSSVVGVYFTKLKTFWRSWKTQTSRSPVSSRHSMATTTTPSSSMVVFVLLCLLWYSTSALSSNTGKAILMQFRYPITLTFIQFGFVALYCLLFMTPMIRFSRLRAPTKAIIKTTLPMGMFQVIGHMFSSIAISRIPVSTVHTIKALSPLFTVAAYAILFRVSYSSKTYISLLPLTVGVMLACSFDVSASNLVGVLSAFGSALVFVSQNIFFKKVMPSNTGGSSPGAVPSHKLDKLNLLLYSSGMAFALTVPLWLYYDLPLFIASTANPDHVTHPRSGHESPHSITYYFFMNGTVHFAQNIIAFIILSSTSPVTYSIASLIKRVAVICIAILWFNQTVHPIQAFGILMTFTGLYMYNNAKSDVDKGEKKMRSVAADRNLILPMTNSDSRVMTGSDHPPDFATVESTAVGSGSLYPRSATTSHALHHPYAISQHQSLTHHFKPLVVNVNQLPTKDLPITSPVDSYPSPPASIHSPPSDTMPLADDYRLYENDQHGHLYPTTVGHSH